MDARLKEEAPALFITHLFLIPAAGERSECLLTSTQHFKYTRVLTRVSTLCSVFYELVSNLRSDLWKWKILHIKHETDGGDTETFVWTSGECECSYSSDWISSLIACILLVIHWIWTHSILMIKKAILFFIFSISSAVKQEFYLPSVHNDVTADRWTITLCEDCFRWVVSASYIARKSSQIIEDVYCFTFCKKAG